MINSSEVIKTAYNQVLKRTQDDPETIHRLVTGILTRFGRHPGLVGTLDSLLNPPPETSVNLMGINFNRGRCGIPAGLDKDGGAMAGLALFGAGFGEVGTVTYGSCPGNTGKRIFRYTEEKTIINQMGLPGPGADKAMENLTRNDPRIPVGVAVAPTPGIIDFAQQQADLKNCLETVLRTPSVRWVSLNLCPNVKTQDVRQENNYFDMVGYFAATARNINPRIPIMLKYSPDLPDGVVGQLTQHVVRLGFDGISAVNTTKNRTGPNQRYQNIEGGISGRPLTARALAVVDIIRRNTDLPIMGGGGVMDHHDYVRMRQAGAELVTIYSGFIFNPFIFNEISQAETQHQYSSGRAILPEVYPV